MAAPDATKAVLGSGILSAGGTQLGIIGNVGLRIPSQAKYLLKEENNGLLTVVWLGGPIILGGIIRGWESDAVATLLPGGSAGPNMTWPFGVGEAVTVIPSVVFTPHKTGSPKITLTNAQAVPEAESIWMFSAYQYMEARIAIVAESGTIAPKA